MLTKRVKNMKPSATVELTAKVLDLKRQGVDVIALNVGEPDFNTPENVCRIGKKAIDEGFTKYTTVSGTVELREAICKKLLEDNKIKYSPKEIIVSTGGKQVLINAVLALCEEGDEVLLPTPCWVSYIEMIKLAGSKPVLIKTEEEDEFQLNIQKIKEAITDKTKAIIINTPNNPTGAVYTEETLRELGQLAVKHDFYIISDEIYEKLVYDGCKHISIASFSSEIKEKTIVVNGFSKAYAMTGWRLGYGAGPAEVIKGMTSLQGHMTTSANSISQMAAVEALEGPKESIDYMRTQYDKRRKYLLDRLNKMKDIRCSQARGAFYLMPNISSLFGKSYKGEIIKDSKDVANFLLDKAHIAVVPGEAFEAPENVRISYSNSLEKIKEAMDRMEKALSILK
ncbi:pyridoxal phosphate-dependent aminotransferase [Maledivibacter halophilus]|uniref:pyridoxal phosphate-dependent aminotransferase n=1 Tax=Maledivibacter halophilus TaxID=36842 RepID=UPI002E8DD17E|nr:pyridoxal phosphate-dependent aminotransferase [Maledivibacter halophilus]